MNKNIIPDVWLGSILQRKTYKLAVDDNFVEKAEDKKKDEHIQLKRICQTKPVFIYAKVSPGSLRSIRFLEKRGFNLVDTNIMFEKSILSVPTLRSNYKIRFATPEDEVQTVELARKSFVYSRFHLDDCFSKGSAEAIKVEWVKNFFLGKRGDTMIVAVADKTIVGFLQLLRDSDSIIVIDLIAVDSNFRRQGIAEDMIAYAEIHCQGAKQIRVGTQIVNTPSINFYEKLGFRFWGSSYVFHYHNI